MQLMIRDQLSQWIRSAFFAPKPLRLYNTLSKNVEEFTLPSYAKEVRMYNCGPTVYDRQHIGNLSAAVFADTIRRVLEANRYTVKQVINITDFGHLVSDADEGEDKMTKGLKAQGKELTMENMRDLATHYMEEYLKDVRALGVDTDKIIFPRASDHIPAQIAMVGTLLEKGYAYKISDGVYFNTKSFSAYGALGNIVLDEMREGSPYSAEATKGKRVTTNPEKKNAADFAVWKFSDSLGWDAPWGKGFPGWHIECSAMIYEILGKQIDIHTGGVEHIGVHHNNEIAQSECATGKHPFSRFWMHREHIRMNDTKIAKSTGNTAYLSDVLSHGINPRSLRYWFLTSSYRTPTNFTWESVLAAQQGLSKLYKMLNDERSQSLFPVAFEFESKFLSKLNDDLDTAGAIGYLWTFLKSAKPGQKRAALLFADKMLGLGLTETNVDTLKHLTVKKEIDSTTLPEDVRKLLQLRQIARADKNWAESDSLRDQLKEKGYVVKDSSGGQTFTTV